MTSQPEGQIITFYSYKGGSSRSMALANVAWILASNGMRVLAVDWDLEAPGLHRYFAPFLPDRELGSCPGIIDLVWEFAVEAVTPQEGTAQGDAIWYESLADVRQYAVPLELSYPSGGVLHFLPAGQQGSLYAQRVNYFDWKNFYERLGGGAFLEAVKRSMRQQYDYILIDSRTGISDTAGICTVQMPDALVVFFTPNHQSMAGGSAVATSVQDQWRANQNQQQVATRRIYPVLARADRSEYDKLDLARGEARELFDRLLSDMSGSQRSAYWGDVEIPYVPWFSYEEILATFRDDPDQKDTLLVAFEQLTRYISNGRVAKLVPPTMQDRERILGSFLRRAATPDSRIPRVSLAKLPTTHPDLFGREKELALLDEAWNDPNTHLLILVAWGGVGKTALVNKWLLGMAKDDYRGADRVLGWSFYSQGAAEGRQASADPFIAHALQWFGDPDPTRGSPWDRGVRLAELASAGRTLLVLDGLEPLQEPPGPEQGHIKDPGMNVFLRGLARHNGGLCVVTTRLPLPDVEGFLGQGAAQVDLENLSQEAGAAYLARLGVVGSVEELRAASAEYGGHALALTLLGSYLATVYRGDVGQRRRIRRLTDERVRGPDARRMLEAYERLYAGKAEGQTLQLLGLFDRPASGAALAALRQEPAVEGLTDLLRGLSEEDWSWALAGLREARLLDAPDDADPESLNAHPLLREYYGERLRQGNEAAWREGHRRLFEYYRGAAVEFPDTLEEMAPLYAAVGHGCRARLPQQALDEVYWQRIQRGNAFYNAKKLGALGVELAVLAGFFEPPWSRVAPGLTEEWQGFVLNEAGYDLRALGRLGEAAQPMRAGIEVYIAQANWENAARGAGNLSGLHLAAGALEEARRAAELSVDLADRSGEAFVRMANRTTLADALRQAGRGEEAEALFRQAEEMQRERQPDSPLLHSLPGYRYCDLLLGRGAWQEVLRRAAEALKVSERNDWLLDIALDHLSLGRAHLHGAQEAGAAPPTRDDHLAAARQEIELAVRGLRGAGQQDELPRGLLARAALRRVEGERDRAQADLDEALALCQRAGLRLHEADAHLEYARLRLACNQPDEARQSLALASAIIAETGYHRRDADVAELNAAL